MIFRLSIAVKAIECSLKTSFEEILIVPLGKFLDFKKPAFEGRNFGWEIMFLWWHMYGLRYQSILYRPNLSLRIISVCDAPASHPAIAFFRWSMSHRRPIAAATNEPRSLSVGYSGIVLC